MRKSLFLLLLSSLLFGCGQKSKISDAIPAQRTAEAYGDGRNTIMPMVLPLSDDTIESFDSPYSKVGFILGGFTKLFVDLGASMGMGKMHLSLTQKIPEIPQEYIDGVNFKRIFFYIEPVRKGKRKVNIFERYFFGKDNVDFGFINRLAVKVSSKIVPESTDWDPIVETELVSSKKFTVLNDIFNQDFLHSSVIDLSQAKELVFLTFDKKKKERYLQNNERGQIFIINTTTPAETRKFLRDHPQLEDVIVRTHILNKSVLVELKKDVVMEERFKTLLEEESVFLEKLGVEFIEACQPQTCFDFKVSHLNLLPVLLKGNAITIDAFIEAGKAPESFQLKGFIEAEVKMNLTF